MPRMVKWTAIAAGGVLALLLVCIIGLVGYAAYMRHANVERFSIETPNGINESTYVSIGGIPQ